MYNGYNEKKIFLTQTAIFIYPLQGALRYLAQ